MAPPRYDEPPFFQPSSEPGFHVNPTAVGPDPTWSTGLCGCFSDSNACCKSFFFPCITTGQIAEIVSEGYTSKCEATSITCLMCLCCGCIWAYTCYNRGKTRQKFNIKGNCCSDCLVHFFMPCCALCQEYRELDHQGFDPSLGWVANIERQRNTAATYPPGHEKMTR